MARALLQEQWNTQGGDPISASFLGTLARFHNRSEAMLPLVLDQQLDGRWVLSADPGEGARYFCPHHFQVTLSETGYVCTAGRVWFFDPLIGGMSLTVAAKTWSTASLSDGDLVWLTIEVANDGSVLHNLDAGDPASCPDHCVLTPATPDLIPNDVSADPTTPVKGTAAITVVLAEIDTSQDGYVLQWHLGDVWLPAGRTYSTRRLVRLDDREYLTGRRLVATYVNETYVLGRLVEVGNPYEEVIITTGGC